MRRTPFKQSKCHVEKATNRLRWNGPTLEQEYEVIVERGGHAISQRQDWRAVPIVCEYCEGTGADLDTDPEIDADCPYCGGSGFKSQDTECSDEDHP